MLHSSTVNHSINKIHERVLKLVYSDDKNLSFEELLHKDNTVSIHQRNLQILALEIFKIKNGHSPQIIGENFEFLNRAYNFRNTSVLKRKKGRTVFYGSESVTSLAPKIWDLLPNSMKSPNSRQQINVHVEYVKLILEI